MKDSIVDFVKVFFKAPTIILFALLMLLQMTLQANYDVLQPIISHYILSIDYSTTFLLFTRQFSWNIFGVFSLASIVGYLLYHAYKLQTDKKTDYMVPDALCRFVDLTLRFLAIWFFCKIPIEYIG